MESVTLKINQSKRFNEVLEESRSDGLPECGDLEIPERRSRDAPG